MNAGYAWVKLWDPLRTCVIPKRLRGVFTTRRSTFTFTFTSLNTFQRRLKTHLFGQSWAPFWRFSAIQGTDVMTYLDVLLTYLLTYLQVNGCMANSRPTHVFSASTTTTIIYYDFYVFWYLSSCSYFSNSSYVSVQHAATR